MRKAAIALTSLLATASASAQRPTVVARGSVAYGELARCRTVTVDAERLACFDRAAAALASAVEAKQVAVVDREEVRAAKRSLFGITLPSIGLFDRDDEEPVQQIESTVRAVGQAGPGRYSFGLTEGGTWRMLESGGPFAPEPGQKVVIRRAALGSYMARIGSGRAVRVERLR